MLKAFSVYDSKSQAYAQPYFARSLGEGERMFRQETKNPQSFLHQYPEDFTLYATGEFCPDTGNYTPYQQHIHVIGAISAKSSPEVQENPNLTELSN